jgi:hypothetical protein
MNSNLGSGGILALLHQSRHPETREAGTQDLLANKILSPPRFTRGVSG